MREQNKIRNDDDYENIFEMRPTRCVCVGKYMMRMIRTQIMKSIAFRIQY